MSATRYRRWISTSSARFASTGRRSSGAPATIPTRRTVKKEWQAGWLLRAVTLIDLTTLAGDDTAGNVRRLCAKAAHPVRSDLLAALGMGDVPLTTGAVCVYHAMVPTAVDALRGTSIPVAAVSTGFPAGLSPLEERVREIRASVAAGRGRSTSSSRAATCSPATGRRCTTR